jgi:hypothetical protein
MNTRSGKLTVTMTILIAAAWCISSNASAAESDIRGPDVTIIAEAEKTVYEYRQGGQLRMVRVIPKWGKPYYLVPADRTKGFGDLERADTLIPSWVIVEF